jgi:hypothetical protein
VFKIENERAFQHYFCRNPGALFLENSQGGILMTKNFRDRILGDKNVFPAIRRCMDDELLREIVIKTDSLDTFIQKIRENTKKFSLPAYLP